MSPHPLQEAGKAGTVVHEHHQCNKGDTMLLLRIQVKAGPILAEANPHGVRHQCLLRHTLLLKEVAACDMPSLEASHFVISFYLFLAFSIKMRETSAYHLSRLL